MKKALEVMNELKEKKLIKDYAIGGAIAALKWVEPFLTRDLDIFVIPSEEIKKKNLIDFSSLYNFLKEKGYTQWIGQWILIENVPVEFLPAIEGLSKEAVENAIETEYEDVKTKVITPEYLMAMFLVAGRDKDILKIKMLLEQTNIDRAKLKSILQSYSLIEKFEKLKE